MQQDMIVILDLGSEQNTLIARDIRTLGVYTEIHPHDITAEQLKALPNVKGIILNGGPNRVVDGVEIDVSKEIYNAPVPVLLADQQGRVVGAVHAGWKSLVAGVIEASVAAMRDKVPDCKLKAWLGPRIGFDDFEVGTEVADVFRTNYPEVADGIKPKDEKFCVDLAAYAKAALNKVGVEDIEDCALSTVTDAQRFFSYRRDGEQTGRHAAVIWIEK